MIGNKLGIDLRNPASYKNCTKKQYEIWVCKPPVGTIILNKFEHEFLIKKLRQIGVGGLKGDTKGCTWFAPPVREGDNKSLFWLNQANDKYNELLALVQSSGNGSYNKPGYVVTEDRPFVLSGTEGEMWVVSANELVSNYLFLENGQPVAINANLVSRRCDANGNMPWHRIRAKVLGMSHTMACFVPLNQKFQLSTKDGVVNVNDPNSLVKHGKGDFIVCEKMPNGQPNLNDIKVVNGLVFGGTYNNQGWQNCLAVNYKGIKDVPKPSEIFTVTSKQDKSNNHISSNMFKQKCDTLMKELQKIYKFEVKSNTYEIVKDYKGIAEEVNFGGDCYVAKFVIGGSFTHTYRVKDKTNGNMVTKSVSADETMIWFGCSATHGDSAIAMTIKPIIENMFLDGWAFPHNSNTKATDSYWSCKVGTINDMNCADEVKTFELKCKGRDSFIDNRKNALKDPLDRLLKVVYDKNSTYREPFKKDALKINIVNGVKSLVIGMRDTYITYNDNCFEFNGDFKAKTDSIQTAASYILELTDTLYKGMFSCFYAPRMNSNQLNALKEYSGNSYESLNADLNNDSLSFSNYMFYCNLHNFLNKCRITRHMPLFRGISGISIHENMILKCDSFSSTSFLLSVSERFGTDILRIRDAYGLHGFFINSISEFRNREWEVLIDAGYDLHIGKVIYEHNGKRVYDCYMKRNESANKFSMNNFKEAGELFIHDLYNSLISRDNVISKCVLELSEYMTVFLDVTFSKIKDSNIQSLNIYCTKDKVIVKSKNFGDYKSEIIKELPISSESSDKIIDYIEDLCSRASINDKDGCMLVYNQVAQKFTDNGFLVIDDELGADLFKLILSGDNDDKVVVKFKVAKYDEGYEVKINGRANNTSINKSKKFDTIENLVNGVYELILKTFKLNSSNRCDSVMNLIANYMKVKYKKDKLANKLFSYTLLNNLKQLVKASLDGNGIVYYYEDKSVNSNHFDNITSVASKVYNMIKGNKESANRSIYEQVVNSIPYNSSISNDGYDNFRVTFNSSGDSSVIGDDIKYSGILYFNSKKNCYVFKSDRLEYATFTDISTGAEEITKLVKSYFSKFGLSDIAGLFQF